MTRESRLLLVVGLLAVLGVTSLALIADRYRRLLAETEETTAAPSAEDAVSRFAAVRREVRRAIDDNLPEVGSAVDPATGRLRSEVSAAVPVIVDRKLTMLSRVGMTGEEYDRIRRVYLAWLRGEGSVAEPLRRSFESRRAVLEELELGPLEDLDVPTAP
jgi:hypothetical protein